MKKMTMKTLMKNAWTLARQGAAKFGGKAIDYIAEAMKKAWEIKRQFEGTAPGMGSLEIKAWFMNKNFTTEEKFVADNSDRSIEKETAKAVLVKFTSKYGNLTKWVPKSCLI